MARRGFAEPLKSVRPRKRRSRMPFLFIGLILFGALIWFAPMLIANSPLKNYLITLGAGKFEGRIATGRVTIGWLTTPVVRDVVVFDAHGDRLLEVTAVRLNKHLAALLANYSELGEIRIEQPTVNLVLRADGSNLEDAIAPWLEPSDSSVKIGCSVMIEDGSVQITDTVAGTQWSATKVGLDLDLPSESTSPLTAQLNTTLNPPNGNPGTLNGSVSWQRPTGPTTDGLGKGHLTVKSTGLPLDLADSLLHRFVGAVTAKGLLNSDVQLDWGDASQAVKVTQLNAQGLLLAAPQWFGEEQIQLASLAVSGAFSRRGGTWQIEPTTIDSDLGHLQASGSATLDGAASDSLFNDLMRAVRQGQFRVEGQLELARLASMLPRTLRIREGTYVSSGQVALLLAGDMTAEGRRWEGRIETRDLAAMYQGRPIQWEQPIVVTAAARDANGTIAFDKLTCESSFLQIEATGTTAQGSATLQGDLAKFASELERFVDLGQVQLAGQLDAKVDWQNAPDQTLRLQGNATAQQFELVAANRPPWREQQLGVTFASVSTAHQYNLQALREAELRVESAGDQLDVKLLPPAAGAISNTTWPVRAQLNGNVTTWLARLQPVFVLPGWNLEGEIDLVADATVLTESLQLAKTDLQLKNFVADNGSIYFNEPVVKIQTTGTWQRATNAFTAPDTTFASSSLAFRAQDVAVCPQATGVLFAGDVSYRGDIGRVLAWFNQPGQPGSFGLKGQATGRVQMRYEQGVTTGDCTADIADFAYLSRDATAGSWSPVWAEPKLKVGTQFTYDPARDVVEIARLEAAGDSLSFAAQGRLSQPTRRCVAELDGQLAYDLEKLTTRLRPAIGNDIQLAGRDSRPFKFQGPLMTGPASPTDGALQPVSTNAAAAAQSSSFAALLTEMLAQGSLSWTSAEVQGFVFGPAELDAKLANGQVDVAPMEVAVSEGKLHLAPHIYLDRTPMVVTLPAGKLAEEVRISREMCGTWFKYIAPLVSDATAAEGRFSVDLSGATVPVDDPMASQVAGTLAIHQAQIGPGPLAQQLLWLAGQVKAIAEGQPLEAAAAPSERWLELPAQNVAFQFADRRVQHEGLRMQVKDVVIQTRGSVGLDQTISLVAEVPVRDEWLAKSPYLQTMRGQTLQVPIQGTLSSPRLDRSALTKATVQSATGAATKLLEGELNNQLNRGLEKLFGRPPQQ